MKCLFSLLSHRLPPSRVFQDFLLRGKMCAHAFTNSLMGVHVFETDLSASAGFGEQVPYRAQTAWLLKQTRVCTGLNF